MSVSESSMSMSESSMSMSVSESSMSSSSIEYTFIQFTCINSEEATSQTTADFKYTRICYSDGEVGKMSDYLQMSGQGADMGIDGYTSGGGLFGENGGYTSGGG